MADFQLAADPRAITGKKVKQLRREGLTPAVVYGPGFDPLNIQVDARELKFLLLEAGGTQLIDLLIGGEEATTLVRDVHRDPIEGTILHVDFYRVAMDRAIRADIPVILIGESAPVQSREAVLMHLMTSVTMETLPANLPPHIEIDISTLTEVGQQVLIEDLDFGDDFEIMHDPGEPIVRLDYPRMIEEEEAGEEEESLFEDIDAGEVEVITEREEDEE